MKPQLTGREWLLLTVALFFMIFLFSSAILNKERIDPEIEAHFSTKKVDGKLK